MFQFLLNLTKADRIFTNHIGCVLIIVFVFFFVKKIAKEICTPSRKYVLTEKLAE